MFRDFASNTIGRKKVRWRHHEALRRRYKRHRERLKAIQDYFCFGPEIRFAQLASDQNRSN